MSWKETNADDDEAKVRGGAFAARPFDVTKMRRDANEQKRLLLVRDTSDKSNDDVALVALIPILRNVFRIEAIGVDTRLD